MFLIFIILFAQAQAIFQHPSVPKLIIISYSGFRYDYFAHNVTPFMNELRKHWGDVRYSKGEFFKGKNSHNVTITNKYSIKTGGILVNDSVQMVTYAQDGLPIWIVNELSGGNRSSGLMMWPGGNFAFNGTRATYIMEFNADEDWNSRIDIVLSWFKDPKRPINLAMLHFEGPDQANNSDTESPSIDDLLSRLDNSTKYLYDQLVKSNLTDVNVIHLSDRMMIDIFALRVINITAIIGNENYEVVGSPSTKIIKPEEVTNDFEIDSSNEENDNDENAVFFIATGPAFEKKCILGPLDNDNLYPLICHVLSIHCHDKSTEAIASFEECVIEIEEQSNLYVFVVVLTSLVVFLVIVVTLMILRIKRRRHQQNFDINVNRKPQENINANIQ